MPMILSLHRRFQRIFEQSYKKNPRSFFCKAVIAISQFVQPHKESYKNFKYRTAFKGILKTRPFPCNPGASTEIHTMVSHYHVIMYLVAIKSFLRFYDDVAIVVHDDGTFTDKDRRLLEGHIQGVKIISRSSADKTIDRILEHYPLSRKCRQETVMALQLYDFFLLSKTNKIVNIDSDSLFFTRPVEVIDWISQANHEIKSLYEPYAACQTEFLSKVHCPFPPHVCWALNGYYKDIFDLPLIENLWNQAESHWICVTQSIFAYLCYAKSHDYRFSFLDELNYQAACWRSQARDGQVFQHYQTSTFLKNYERHVADAEKVIKEIREGG